MGKTIPELTALTSAATDDYFVINDTSASNATKKISYEHLTVGSTLQIASASYSAVDTTTDSIPYDDTIPQNTEGKEFMSVTITPIRANSKLLIRYGVMFACSAKSSIVSALFRDSTANAIAASATEAGIDDPRTDTVQYIADAVATTATTFKVRMGTASGTLTFNGESGARKFGAIQKSYITVMEIAQ